MNLLLFLIFFLFFSCLKSLFNIRILTLNRPKSLARLLDSLDLKLNFSFNIDIEFFVDALPVTHKLDNNTVELIQNFRWKYGKKYIIKNKYNAGLKEQWLRYYSKLPPLLILEDDMVLCDSFFDLAILSINFLQKKNFENVFGISFQRLRLILRNDNCENFKPNDCLKKYVAKNQAFFLQQMATWAPMVFRDKWNELVRFYKKSKSQETKLIHCIPGAISNMWYNTSGTFMQFFFHLKNYTMLYFNTENHFAINMKENGLHFNDKKKSEIDYCIKNFEPKNISFNNLVFFDNGFNPFFMSDLNRLAPSYIENENKPDLCKINK